MVSVLVTSASVIRDTLVQLAASAAAQTTAVDTVCAQWMRCASAIPVLPGETAPPELVHRLTAMVMDNA